MVFLAFGYGLVLGGAQFFLLKALLAMALAGGGRARRLPLLLTAKLLVYLAAVLGALRLFETALLPAGLGLGAGLVGMALASGIRSLRRANTAQRNTQQKEGNTQ